MNPIHLLGQLATQLPLALVYVAGIVLPIFFWKRARVPSTLTLVASGLMLVMLIGNMLGHHLIVRAANSEGWDHERTSALFAGLASATAVVRAIAFGMLIGAVFVGRNTLGRATGSATLGQTG